MSSPRYKIVFDGQLMPDTTLEAVKENLARLFKSTPTRIDTLFGGTPVALKRDLSDSQADQYLAALQKAGARVRKEVDQSASLSLVPTDEQLQQAAPTKQPPMSCPKCGHEQPKTNQCTACGIIIEKYLARQAQLAEQQSSPAPAVSPYAPPQADVAGHLPEFCELKVFSISGRIGRLRYLGWSMGLMLLAMLAYGIAMGVMTILPILGGVLMLPIGIAIFVVSVMIGVQRLHDIGWSGWLWLLNFAPLIGFVFTLLMFLIPGTSGANRYGPPPPPNSRGVTVLAWGGLLLGIIAFIGILAAIAIPAYQSYLEHAQ